jgi:hypothetical protein
MRKAVFSRSGKRLQIANLRGAFKRRADGEVTIEVPRSAGDFS